MCGAASIRTFVIQLRSNQLMSRRFRFPISKQKLRGIPRRLRAIKKWPGRISSWITPDVWASDAEYWNYKIPADSGLMQGKYATAETRRACAQGLIDAAARIIALAPVDQRPARVTCVVILPDMFASEVCIYLSEDYFDVQVGEGTSLFGTRTFIRDRSLAIEWGLNLPPGMTETGLTVITLDDDDQPYHSEYWYFGEVSR